MNVCILNPECYINTSDAISICRFTVSMKVICVNVRTHVCLSADNFPPEYPFTSESTPTFREHQHVIRKNLLYLFFAIGSVFAATAMANNSVRSPTSALNAPPTSIAGLLVLIYVTPTGKYQITTANGLFFSVSGNAVVNGTPIWSAINHVN